MRVSAKEKTERIRKREREKERKTEITDHREKVTDRTREMWYESMRVREKTERIRERENREDQKERKSTDHRKRERGKEKERK